MAFCQLIITLVARWGLIDGSGHSRPNLETALPLAFALTGQWRARARTRHGRLASGTWPRSTALANIALDPTVLCVGIPNGYSPPALYLDYSRRLCLEPACGSTVCRCCRRPAKQPALPPLQLVSIAKSVVDRINDGQATDLAW